MISGIDLDATVYVSRRILGFKEKDREVKKKEINKQVPKMQCNQRKHGKRHQKQKRAQENICHFDTCEPLYRGTRYYSLSVQYLLPVVTFGSLRVVHTVGVV